MSELTGRRAAVAVIGAGQAGLAMSHCLQARGIDHVVLERNRIGHEWRERRWDSFCLVTPNWQCLLPGFPYAGPDPHGFMQKDEIVAYLEAYAASFRPPLHEGVAVTRLWRRGGPFFLATTAGEVAADQVVVATGGYHLPKTPRMSERLPSHIEQLHSSEYRNPAAMGGGGVLVVGSGQSGCQIAEDLHLAGRSVHLVLGSAPRTARRYRGKDVVEWLDKMGHYKMPIHEHPLKEGVRAKANHYVTGRDGGRDIDLRQRATEGMRLYGRLEDVRGSTLRFAANLARSLDEADAVAESIKRSIDKFIVVRGIDAPAERPYAPVWRPEYEPRTLDLAESGVETVIWATGFAPDYRYVELPVFDGKGHPCHERGVTSVEGLYFVGLPWLYTWGSGRFCGVGDDADYIAGRIQARLGAPDRQPRDRKGDRRARDASAPDSDAPSAREPLGHERLELGQPQPVEQG
jgi:putative flavoprotein involved in K+ transport